MTVRLMLRLAIVVVVVGVAGCDEPGPLAGDPTPAPEVKAETPAPAVPTRDERRLTALANPPADVRPGELTADEAGHVVDLIASLPDDLAFARLHAYGPGIGSAVAGLLASEKPLDRVAGVKLAHGLRLAQHYDLLAELRADKDARVRRSLTLALTEIGTDEHVHAMIPLMDDPEFFIRLASQRALADRGDRGLMEYARKVVEVEKRVARLRAFQALADVAVPSDAAWFKQQLGRDLDVSTEREEVWRGLALADPQWTLGELKKRRASKKDPMGWHEYHTALRALSPNAPEEVVLAELNALLPGAGKRVYADLAHAVSRTPGEAAEAKALELLTQDRWGCEIIKGRLGAEKEWTAAEARFDRELAREDSPAKPQLQERLAALRANLVWLKPLADSAMDAQLARVGKEGLCNNLGRELGSARLDQLAGQLGHPEPRVRGELASLLGRYGQWSHAQRIAALYHDVDPGVRRKARLALRLQVGIDLRAPEGFLWHAWYVHTFGPLPAQHHPAPDPSAALAEDLAQSMKARPLNSKPKTTQDKGLQPRKFKEPSSTPASQGAPGK